MRLAEDATLSEREAHRAEAYLALGDAHYYGLGVPQDRAKAMALYDKGPPDTHTILFDALARKQCACAMGWAYQFGLGKPQDFNLAKRCATQLPALHPALLSKPW